MLFLFSLRGAPSEETSGSLEVGRAHHIVAVLELRARLEAALLGHLLLLLHQIGATLHHHDRGVLPLDLELGYSGLFNEDVSGKLLNDGSLRGVLSHLRVFIVVVDVVADTEELLVGVGAGNEDTCDTHDLRLLDLAHIGWLTLHTHTECYHPHFEFKSEEKRATYLEGELHLSWLYLVHLGLLQDLI